MLTKAIHCLRWSLILLGVATGNRSTLGFEFDQGSSLTLTEENDFVNGTDRWYTQGARISFSHGDNQVPLWVQSLSDRLPALGYTPSALRLGCQLGQSLFTPANTHASELLTADRPYAAWLYGGTDLQRRGVGIGEFLSLESLQLQIGIIGPEAFGDHVQTWYHHQAPRGWANQIDDEPGIAVRYGRSWLIPVPDIERHCFDILPEAGVSAGNVDTSFRIGTLLRAGWNIPQDFGPKSIDSITPPASGYSPSSRRGRWGFYIFSGVEGRAVLYNAFLDGNAFRTSHHVDKELLVGEWRSGLTLVFKQFELVYMHVLRTKEFELQSAGHIFGSLTLKYKF